MGLENNLRDDAMSQDTNCALCKKRLPDFSREHGSRVEFCGHSFCSMSCADAWEHDATNAEEMAAKNSRANCVAYVDCLCAAMMLDIQPAQPPFASCDAVCPLRRSRQ